MTERVADINAVLDAGRKLLGLDQIGAHDCSGPVEYMSAKVFDQLVFGRPAALGRRIPLHLPLFDLVAVGASLKLAAAPDDGRARQATYHLGQFTIR